MIPGDEEPPRRSDDVRPARGADQGAGRPTSRPLPPLRASRRGKVLAWTAASVVGVLLLAGLGVGVVYAKLSGNIHSSDIQGRLGADRPGDRAGGDMNILVLGSDTRAGTSGQYGPQLGSQQSDTMLIVHIPADRKWAAVVSVPRDSWVAIPSCDEGDGRMSQPTHFKINHAYAEGSLHGDTTSGAVCAIRTVELDTHIRIDHFVVVSFLGLQDMTRAVGGVPVCVTAAVNDPKSGLRLPAGTSVVEGEQALAFVRARYTLGDGSDLGRIHRQQQFMASMARQAKSKLLDPPALYSFLDAATKSLTTDSGLGSLKALYDVAASVQGLPTSALEFLTVPNEPRSLVDPADRANVVWKEPQAHALFDDLARDVDPATGTEGPPGAVRSPGPGAASPAPSPTGAASTDVRLRVLNGSGLPGRAGAEAAALRARGDQVVGVGNARHHYDVTTVLVPAGDDAVARQLLAQVPGAVTDPAPAGVSTLTLVLGTSWPGVDQPAPGSSLPGKVAPALTGSQARCSRT